MAEQTSCTKPGRVSSIEREPPPIVSLASYTMTDLPARAMVIAAARPFGPAPITTASYFCFVDIFAFGYPQGVCLLFITLAPSPGYPAQRGSHDIYSSAHGGIMPDVFRV